MELLFSCISGQGTCLEEAVYYLNKKSSGFFEDKSYSNIFSRVMFIFVPKFMSYVENDKYKVKYVTKNNGIAINIYLNIRLLMQGDLENGIDYLSSVLFKSLEKNNNRFKKLDINMIDLHIDLKTFFDLSR